MKADVERRQVRGAAGELALYLQGDEAAPAVFRLG
jgi:hypothetical protein